MVQQQNPSIIAIASGKGGVGKTSISVNLAFCLASKGRRVLLVDGDLGLANVDILLGLNVRKTIRDVLDNGIDPRQVLIYPQPYLGILPAATGIHEMVNLGPEDQTALSGFLSRLAADFDFVLFDTAAGIGSSVLWFNRLAQHSIIVLTPDPTSVTDAYALLKVLEQKAPRPTFFALLNGVGDRREGERVFYSLENVVNRFLKIQLAFLGAIPQDPVVPQSVRQQTPFIQNAPGSPAGQAIQSISGALEAL